MAGLRDDALDLDAGRLLVIRTVTEVSGNTGFKPFPKTDAAVGPCRFPRGLWQ